MFVAMLRVLCSRQSLDACGCCGKHNKKNVCCVYICHTLVVSCYIRDLFINYYGFHERHVTAIFVHVHIEDITQLCEDMDFTSSGEDNSLLMSVANE